MHSDNFSVPDNDLLTFLLGRDASERFFAVDYEQEAVVHHAGDATRFLSMVSIDAIDRLVTGTDIKEGELILADAGREGGVDTEIYVDDEGFIDRGAVVREYDAGATIILNQAQRVLPALGQFCQALEHCFSSHVQTNLYLTPPGAQGFPTHFDNHDVFVIQVEGEKLWRLYDKPVDTPFRGERFESAHHDRGPLRHEFVLKAGDCAYVPRGLMHDAATSGDSPSLHIAVGLIVRTWADLVLEAVSEVALREPAFRRALPPGHARSDFDRVMARETMAALGTVLAREMRLDPAMDVLADTFVRTRPACARGMISASRAPIADDARFIRAAHVALRRHDAAGATLLAVPGGDLKVIVADRPALDVMLSGSGFTLQQASATLSVLAPAHAGDGPPPAGDNADPARRAEALLRLLLAYGIVQAD